MAPRPPGQVFGLDGHRCSPERNFRLACRKSRTPQSEFGDLAKFANSLLIRQNSESLLARTYRLVSIGGPRIKFIDLTQAQTPQGNFPSDLKEFAEPPKQLYRPENFTDSVKQLHWLNLLNRKRPGPICLLTSRFAEALEPIYRLDKIRGQRGATSST